MADKIILGGGFASTVFEEVQTGKAWSYVIVPDDYTSVSGIPFEKSEIKISEWMTGHKRPLTWKDSEDVLANVGQIPRNETIILQAFNMSYKYIRDNIPEIAKRGYTTIQVSPINRCIENLGVWWELYQPVDLLDFNNVLGTEAELKSLIDECHANGLEIIADFVINHMADPLRYIDPKGPLYYPGLEPKNFNYPTLFLSWHMFQEAARAYVSVSSSNEKPTSTSGYQPSPKTVLPHDLIKVFFRVPKPGSNDAPNPFFAQFLEWNYKMANPFKIDDELLKKENQHFLADYFYSIIYHQKVTDISPNIPQELSILKNVRAVWGAVMAFIAKEQPRIYEFWIDNVREKFSTELAAKGLWADDLRSIENKEQLDRFNSYWSDIEDVFDGMFGKLVRSFFPQTPLVVRPWMWQINYKEPPRGSVIEWDELPTAWVEWFPGLPDLDITQEVVRNRHKEYLKKAIKLGIDGFRFDAIKHVPYNYVEGLLSDIRPELSAITEIANKNIYCYGEIATDDMNIANMYRQRMAVTDFFWCGSLLGNCKGERGDGNLNSLRLSKQIRFANDWIAQDKTSTHIFPVPGGQDDSIFTPSDKSSPLSSFNWRFKPVVRFSRLHDTVVNFMFKFDSYTNAMIGYAVTLAQGVADILVYGSDEKIEVNAGPDYKEDIVIGGIAFNQLCSPHKYLDQYQPEEYAPNIDPRDVIFVDRGDVGLAIINQSHVDIEVDNLKLANLKPGRKYVEIMTGNEFDLEQDRVLRGKTILPKCTAAYIIARNIMEPKKG